MRLFGLEITRAKAAPPPGMLTSAPMRSGSWLYALLEPFAGAWQRDLSLDNTQTLLAQSAVFACITRIASDVAMLRPMLMSIDADGIWTEVTENSPYLPVIRKPNDYQTRIQFIQAWVTSKLIYGNAFILKERDNRGGEFKGVVRALYVLDPRLVRPMVAADGSVWYRLSADELSGLTGEIVVPASEIIHDRMCTLLHPLVGVSPLVAAALSATQSRRIQHNSAKFFENMSRPSGHLSHPGTVSTEQLAVLKKQFEEGFSAGNLGRLLVTGGGASYTAMTIPAEQSQLIEQLKWTIEDVARSFHVPLYKIGAGQQPTYSNIGALNQDYYDQTLRVHIEDIELLLTEGLGLSERTHGVELEIDSLLRMDPKTRAETTEIFMRAGVYSPNEARFRENLPSVDGGDQPFMQQQMWQVGQLANREAPQDMPPAPKPTPDAEPEDDADEDLSAAEEESRALLETIAKGLDETTV